VPPVLLINDLGEGFDLAVDDLLGLVALALLERLADAEDDLDARLERGGGLSIAASVVNSARERERVCVVNQRNQRSSSYAV
jgi:hypothetical protein